MTDTEKLYEIYLKHPEVTTDSRRCPEGSMFFALKGESFDGNRFASKALEAGSAVAVVDDETVIPEGDERYVLVADVLEALQALAAHHRQQFQGPVVQVTGTNGKTTTKELIAAVLSQRYRVLYTQGNLNNHIGVPLTLLRLRPAEHEIAIIETGANHPGEIRFLTQIVQPDYGLITNVGRAHIEGFGSFEGVKSTKGELYDYLCKKTDAHVFINASNDDLCGMLRQRGFEPKDDKCIAYGHTEQAPVCICTGSVIDSNPMLRMSWQHGNSEPKEVQTRLIGAYNIDNVLAAAAIGLHFGVTQEAVSAALSDYQPSLGRSEYRRTAGNELIIDAYNANLTSMQAALDNFSHISHAHKMVILGDMKELGAVSAEAHLKVAEQALATQPEAAWFVGDEFAKALATLAPATETDIRCFPDVAAAQEAIAAQRPSERLILIKGSNSTKLHQLPELL